MRFVFSEEFMSTSLKDSITLFKNFINGLEDENKENRRIKNEELGTLDISVCKLSLEVSKITLEQP